MSIISTATEFATKAHNGQYRKYTGEPYVTHPLEVCFRLSTFMSNEAVLAAAILHDTVEDTDATIEQINDLFGEEVASYVWYLTKPPTFVGNRAHRKNLCSDRLRQAPKLARLIKVFDLWHNSESIRVHDPKFWLTFKQETKELLVHMDAFEVVLEFCGSTFANETFLNWVLEINND